MSREPECNTCRFQRIERAYLVPVCRHPRTTQPFACSAVLRWECCGDWWERRQ